MTIINLPMSRPTNLPLFQQRTEASLHQALQPSSSKPNSPISGLTSDQVNFGASNLRPLFSGILKYPFAPKINEATLVVFDLETTGVEAGPGEVTQIAALKYQGGKLLGKYTTLVKPKQPISEFISNLTHIYNTDAEAKAAEEADPSLKGMTMSVENAPPITEAIPKLAKFVGENTVLVGHNVKFDIDFIRAECDENGLSKFKDRFDLDRAFCTYTLSEKVFRELRTQKIDEKTGKKLFYDDGNPRMVFAKNALKLGSIADYLKIDPPGELHNAVTDVKVCAEVFYRIAQRLRNHGTPIETLQDLKTFQGDAIPYWTRKKMERAAEEAKKAEKAAAKEARPAVAQANQAPSADTESK